MLTSSLLPLTASAAGGKGVPGDAPDAAAAKAFDGPAVPPGALFDIDGNPYVPGEVLVKFAKGVSAGTTTSAHKQAGAKDSERIDSVPGLECARLPRSLSVSDAIARYEALPGVEYAQPNYLHHVDATPDDPRFDELWGMFNVGQTGGTPDADIDATDAWNQQTGDPEVVVAVIDTGVDYNHPDLADNMWTNPGEIPGNGIDDDDNGFVDDVHGYDFFNEDGDPIDDHSHGTHCSGTIGAVADNGTGVAGVAWDVSIMALKFLSADGWGDTVDAIECIEYADAMGADILSNSWGGGPYEQALYDAIAGSDALFVAAAGNDSMDTDRFENYPSCYDAPNVLAVGATDHNDEIAWFSNWGAETVDVFAPGEEVLSTVPGTPPVFTPSITATSFVSACDDLTGWDTSAFARDPWSVSSDTYVSPPGAFARLKYRNNEDSWIKSGPLDLSAHASSGLRFQVMYDVEEFFDRVSVLGSADGIEWTTLRTFDGNSGGFIEHIVDLSAFSGDDSVYIAFRLQSDESVSGASGFEGAAVDDIELVELSALSAEDFDDLTAWDASDFDITPWALQDDWFTSPDTAAGLLGYEDNESSWLKTVAPIDMSAAPGGIALNANVFYFSDTDTLSVLASTDGSNWTPLAKYSGFSGTFEPGFERVSIDMSAFAGEPEVYLALHFASDGQGSSQDGLIGVAVDDIAILEGEWTEADYDDAYELFSGTSMATPHVAGIAALVLSEWPGRSAADLKTAVIKGADYLENLDGMCVSNGRANAYRSIQDLWGPNVTDDAREFYTARAEITLSAVDDTGVDSITYRFDDEDPETVFNLSSAPAATTRAAALTDLEAVASYAIPGAHTLTYWGTDTLGNESEPVTVGFTIERGAVSAQGVAGADRFATSVEASKRSFPDGAEAVVITTGRNWPDALGGTALAGALDAPILLTEIDKMPTAVAEEVERLGATHAYVLGGTRAISGTVITQLAGMMGRENIVRIAGADRYETADLIAREVIALRGESYDGIAFVATGANFPDALGAAPVARHRAWPILLADPAGALAMPTEVSSAVILGGYAAVGEGMEAALVGKLGEGNVTRKGGTDRYGTAALVAGWSIGRGMHWEGVGLATGRNFADALAGGAMLGSMRSVLLLTPPAELLPVTRAPLSVNKEMIQTVHFVGGANAVTQPVRDDVMATIE